MNFIFTSIIAVLSLVGIAFTHAEATKPPSLGASQTISSLTELTSLSHNDVFPITDTANATTKKLKWGTATATMKTIFDPLYSPIAGSASLVTLGTVTTGTWNADTIAVSKGGTGSTSLIAYQLLAGNGTGAVTTFGNGTSGYVLTSNGAGALPSFQNVGVTTGNNNTWTGTNTFSATTTLATTTSSNLIGKHFGGTGIDGALVITSGTTTIDLGSAAVVEKNYTSISITGTGALEFSNPATNGTIVILRSQGDFTHTSSKQIYLVGVGSAGGVGGTGGTTADNIQDSGDGGGGGASMTAAGAAGQNSADGDSSDTDGTIGNAFSKWLYSQTAITGGGGGGGSGGAVSISPLLDTTYMKTYLRWLVLPGSGGGGGEQGSTAGNVLKDGSTGGRGGGGLYVEVGGSLNITGTINAMGANSTSTVDALGGCGGGGGGGSIQIFYNNLIANSGTYSVSGGTSGGTCTYTGGTGANGYSSVVKNTNF